jgi:predicted nucleic acid-binding protein
MILVDTGALVALLDAGDEHHAALRGVYDDDPEAWVLPWAILPEVDYLVSKYLGAKAQDAWLGDLADGAFAIEWGKDVDMLAARRVHARHKALGLGLVDAIVMAMAERLEPAAIATLDLRHFGAVPIKGNPRLLPRDR